MKLFRIQFLLLSVFVFVGWMAMQQPSANAGQGAEASSAQPSVTPQKGQNAEEQKKDLAECYDIAKAKTGIDPSALLSKKVPGLGEAAAAAGAGGAAPGGAGQGESAQPPAGGQAQGADKQAKLDKFQIANQACLKARGYLVKGQAPATAPAAEQPK